MASLDSEAAFGDRAEKIGIEKWIVEKISSEEIWNIWKTGLCFSIYASVCR